MDRLMPAFSLAVLAIVAVLPMGGSGGELLWQALPLLAAIFFWAARGNEAISARVVFLSGLAVDVLGGGTLIGLWALLALVTYGCALVLRPVAADSSIRQWGAFGVAMVAVNALHLGIASGLSRGQVAAEEFAIAVLVGVAIYPVSAVVLAGLEAIRSGRPVGRVI